MNDLDAQIVGQVIEVAGFGVVRDLLALSLAEFFVRERLLRDLEERVLGEVTDQAGVCSVFDHRCRPELAPRGDHPPQIHVAPIEGSLCRMFVAGSGVGIPKFYGGVHIQDAPVVAPLHDFATVDIPCQVNEEISFERCCPSRLPRFSGVTRSLTRVMPCSIQGFRAASFGSNSTIVTRLGSMLKCRIKMGSVQRATAPKPTNKTRF
jgi:hypothetical protein